jgi:hypothetical protein
MINHMIELLAILINKAYEKDPRIRVIHGDRTLTAFLKTDRYLTVTWKLDTFTDSMSRPANWPDDL